ncbi:hypothetical protein DL764_004173 [Monosporascus ibericus]|uniref:Nucleoporin Nup54 alpha-helical domain-containing protein n=1 Tax=Monosporascus ibericus TaxID=155417 RepID=A0A4Q4THW2_9PEZI|nr:hypothetical protein DL764_004173 [Monosporascus ibericus]
MFGSASQPQSQPQPQSQQQQQTGSGLFGNTLGTPKSAAALLGGATATSQPQHTGSSLFGGASNASTSQPQQATGGGGLFGNTSTSTATSQTQQQQQTGSSLFGTAGGAASQPQQTGTSLFGNATQTQSQPSQAGSLFSSLSKPAQAAGNTTGSLFGQPAQQKPGLFGGLNQPPQAQTPQSTMGLGASLGLGSLGQSTNQQQTVPGVRIDLSNLKGTTRFSDLQENLQKTIEDIDKFILNQIRHQEELQSFMPGHGDMLENVPEDVKFVTRKYEGARSALESDAHAIEAARSLVNQDADHARLSFRAIDNLKLPQQYHTPNLWAPRQQSAGTANTETDGQDLVGFFSKTADEMGEQLRRYERNLTEIETHLHGVQDGLVEQLQKAMATKNRATSATDEKIQELVAVLRDFEQGILKVAGEVGSAREGMTRLQLGEFVGNDGRGTGIY